MDMTQLGLEHVDECIEHVFSFIGLMRKVGPTHDLFKEIGLLSRTEFLFAQKQQPEEEAQRWNEAMLTDRARAHYLSSGRVMEVFEPKRITDMLELMTPELCNVTLISSSIPESALSLREPHYGVAHSISKLKPELVARCSDLVNGIATVDPSFRYPDPNRFVASDFSLVPLPAGDVSPFPESLVQDRFCHVWYHQDKTFKLPHAVVAVQLRSATAYISPEVSALNSLLAKILNETLNSITYEASCASLHFDVGATDTGLRLNFSGLSHKLPSLLAHVMEVLENSCAKLALEHFSSLREKLLRDLQNYHVVNPCYLRTHYYGSIVSEVPRWEPHECADALKSVTLDRFKLFVKDFFHSVFFLALISGNVSKDKAWSITDRIRRTLFHESAIPISPAAVWQVEKKN